MEAKVIPYKDESKGKKEQVAAMFDKIASSYDFLNHLLSFGIDIIWRKKAVKMLKEDKPKMILDVATGTGDFAIQSMSLNPDKIFGIDISKEMIKIGVSKIKKKGLDGIISLAEGDAEDIKFDDETFDAITIGFGVRNFENVEKGLGSMYRVLKNGGKLVVLEFSKPKLFPFKQIYHAYFFGLLPFVGKMFSDDDSAYTYLPESVKRFPDGKDFTDLLVNQGFGEIQCKSLFFGIAAIYVGKK